MRPRGGKRLSDIVSPIKNQHSTGYPFVKLIVLGWDMHMDWSKTKNYKRVHIRKGCLFKEANGIIRFQTNCLNYLLMVNMFDVQ